MSNRAYALMAGIFVLVLGGAIIAAAVWIGGSRQPTVPYIVETDGSVSGVVPHSTVFFRGIPAGRVASVGFDPKDPRQILIRLDVNRGTPITRDTYAVLSLQGLTGGSHLDLDTDGTSRELLPTSRAAPAYIPLRPSLIGQLSNTAPQLMKQLQQLATALNDLLNSDNRAHVAELIAHANAASAGLVKLESDLDVEVRQLPALTGQMRSTLTRIDALTASLDRVAQQADALARTGQNAGRTLNAQTLPRLNAALSQISAASAEVRRLSESLRKNPQQLLEGRERPAPGPGEPGYKGSSR